MRRTAAMPSIMARRIRPHSLTVGMSSNGPTLAVELLLDGSGSGSFAVTVAVLVSPSELVMVPLMVMVAVEPLVSVPMLQVTVVVPLQEPWVEVAVVSAKFGGSGSFTTTFVAVLGPLFSTTSV